MAQHAYHIGKYLDRKHDVIIVTPREIETQDGDYRFTFNRLLTMRYPEYDALLLRKMARAFNPDVIHACTAGIAFSTISREYPTITRVVGNDFLRPWCGYNLKLRSILYRLPLNALKKKIRNLEDRIRKNKVIGYLNDSKIIAANSKWTRDRLIECGISQDKVKLIVGGVDTNKFKPTNNRKEIREELGFPTDGLILSTAANLIKKKGIETVIRNVAKLRNNWPLIRYVVVGKGEDEEDLRSLALKLGIKNHVIFSGQKSQKELAKIYQGSDIYILLSKNETMGRTYMEAGACGLPVIGPRVEGVPSVVKNGENGLLVENIEDDMEIAKCIETLLKDNLMRKRLGEEGSRIAKMKYSWDRIGEAFEREMLLLK